MESELAYSFRKSWSPPASPSRDHFLGASRPQSPVSARTHRLKTVIRSSTPSPRRSPKLPAARAPYRQPTEEEARVNPSVEAEKAQELNDMGEIHTPVPPIHAAKSPEWNENVRWEDCVAFASELELSPQEHPVEWLTHVVKDEKKQNPLHWPKLKERVSFTRDEKVPRSHEERV